MLLALASAGSGMVAIERSDELDRQNSGVPTDESSDYPCFGMCVAPALFILGVALVIRAARTAPRPPDPPTSF